MDKNKALTSSNNQEAAAPGKNTGKVKEKRKSNEKRKEKSRDAARFRRSRETEIFNELGDILPVRKEDVEQLDKASVMRLSIAFLKIQDMLKLFPNIPKPIEENNNEDQRKQDVEAKPFDLCKIADDCSMLKNSLDGFLLILSNEGDITFASENISEYLGLSMIDILGQQIWEYSHQCDHDELKDALNMKKHHAVSTDDKQKVEGISTEHRDFFIRMKCTLTSRGRSVNIKSALYKVIHITGHSIIHGDNSVLVAVGRPIPHPSNIEIPMGTTTFLTKHSLDMKFTYVDEKMFSLFKYKSEDLMGTSLYECHHGGDSESLMATYKSVLNKGQGETCRYRFLGKYGGYCWIVTQATIVYDKQKPQSVVCVNYVISNLENNNEIYSLAQLEASQQQEQSKIDDRVSDEKEEQQEKSVIYNSPTEQLHKKSCESIESEIVANNKNNNNKIRESSLSPLRRTLTNCTITPVDEKKSSTCEKRPKSVTASVFRVQEKTPSTAFATKAQSVTASVFTPISKRSLNSFVNRTQSCFTSLHKSSPPDISSSSEDMHKGFLSFAEDTSELAMLKEEPDDLTHLAPTAGDTCLPLDESAPLFGEMLENLILPDSYGLLPDDINSLDSERSQTNTNNKSHIDPFINYRDESNDTSCSQHLLSPSAASKSPESNSIPSLCSPNSLSQEDDFAFMTMSDDIDLNMRAPYIPMNEQDDLPLLTDDLMWSGMAFAEDAIQIDSLKSQLNSANVLVCKNPEQQFPTTPSYNQNSSSDNSCNNSTNNNDYGSESSLSALLCSANGVNNSMDVLQHHHQQQQNRQTPTESITNPSRDMNLSINCKTEKYDSCTTNLFDSYDAFENDYNKDSSNLDCWTMNDSTISALNQEKEEKLSKYINTTATLPTTLHVPLIAIQNNKNLSINRTSAITTIPTTITYSNSSGNNNNNNSSKSMNDENIISNRKLTTPATTKQLTPNPTNNTAATIRIPSNLTCDAAAVLHNNCKNLMPSKATTLTFSPPSSHKRHLTSTKSSIVESKRIKNASTSVEVQTSPQLLQQLMAPTSQQQPHRQRDKATIILGKLQPTTAKWNHGNGTEAVHVVGYQRPSASAECRMHANHQPAASNSVLKNLLVSGCDSSSSCQILDSGQCKLPVDAGPPKACDSNPFIAGRNIFLSPSDITTGPDRVPSVLMDTDSSTDSGIDEISSDRTSVLPSSLLIGAQEGAYTPQGSAPEFDKRVDSPQLIDLNLISNLSNSGVDVLKNTGPPPPPPPNQTNRKPSFSFLDDPMSSSFILEFCNNDYSMVGSEDFLADGDIENVFKDLV